MVRGGEENETNIVVFGAPKKYSKEFLEKINNKRIDIISSIVLRLASENKI